VQTFRVNPNDARLMVGLSRSFTTVALIPIKSRRSSNSWIRGSRPRGVVSVI